MNQRSHGEADEGRNARREAQRLVGDDLDARVLEPSPPAVVDGEWFADDPVAVDSATAGRPVVSPVPGADLTWSEWLGDHADAAGWASERWLGAYRRLTPPTAAFTDTRLALHRIAAYVVSPARRRANTKIGLRWTMGGFGTPFFAGHEGPDEQVRVAGARLVWQRGEVATAEPLTTLAEAASFVLGDAPDVAWADGFDMPPAGDPDAPLRIDRAAADVLGDWFGLAWSVLEELRAAAMLADRSRVQLWPEHFDAAFDCAIGDRPRRVTFGASPGDKAVPEPYLYVLPADFDGLSADDVWNATTFSGALLPLSGFVTAPDQRAAALAFFRSRLSALARAG